MKPTLVVLAAGMGSRYGGLKQVDPVGPSGEAILDYSVFDAVRAGFGKVIFVIRRDFEAIFREQVGRKYEGVVQVEYAFQDFDDLPAPYKRPADRTKPWGTAHAVRAARNLITGPFAAINADDFYGRDAFQKLAEFLMTAEDSAKASFAMVGYELNLTLSDNGSVARGICSLDAAGNLVDVTELTKLVKSGDGVINDSPDMPRSLTGKERVSMNLWGFTAGFVGMLDERFNTWLALHSTDLKAECYLPFVVNDLVHDGLATVKVLPTSSKWFGVTYRDDKPFVMESIKKLVEAGEYPSPLFKL